MKKLILFIFFTGLFKVGRSQSQEWCAHGATWHYRVNTATGSGSYTDGYLKLELTGSVTIGTAVCQEMIGRLVGSSVPSGAPVNDPDYIHLFTRQENGMILIFNPEISDFDTIVDFNAAIGDQWRVIRFPFFSCLNDIARTPVTVLDTGHVTINAVSLKRIVLDVPNPESNGTYTVVVIEKMLNISGFLFPYLHDICMNDGASYGNFSCYSDDNFATYNPGAAECEYVTGIKNYYSNTGLRIYPNPGNGNFKIEVDSPAELSVYDLFGRKLHSASYEKQQSDDLNLCSYPAGIYYIKGTTGAAIKLIKE